MAEGAGHRSRCPLSHNCRSQPDNSLAYWRGVGSSPVRSTAGPAVALADPEHRVLDPPACVARALARALRQALHDPPSARPAVRDAVRPRGGQAGLHRSARRAAPRRGSARARAGRRPQLGDPARRGGPHGAAQADAAGLPRRAHGAAVRADGGGRRARGGLVAARRARRAPPAHAGPHARDHPARRLRPRSRPAPRRAARAAAEDARVRRQADQPDAAAGRQPRREGARAGRPVRVLRPPPGSGGRADLRAGRGAPRRRRGARRRAGDAARRPPRGRLADERPGAARRAAHAARRRARDHRVLARLGVRPPARTTRRCCGGWPRRCQPATARTTSPPRSRRPCAAGR